MQKIINSPQAFARDTIEGILAAHPERLEGIADGAALVRADRTREGKVGIATGGGSGHLPLFLGYVGAGLLDGVAVGGVFSSPSADTMLEVTQRIDSGAGVLYLYGNYGGDVMNFDLAAELAAAEGITVDTILGADDVASAPIGEEDRRRGIAGLVLLYKVAGAAADRGWDLARVAATTRRAAEGLRTMGVALAPCTLPAVGRPTFTIEPGEMAVGMGIHGEPGVRSGSLSTADEIADELLEAILPEVIVSGSQRFAVLVNGLGATPIEELYILFRRVKQRLIELGHEVAHVLVGEYATSLEMAGASLSLLRLDDELLSLLDAPARTPFLAMGGELR